MIERKHLYERIAQRLHAQIEEGTFRIGDRLPSIRQLCAQERVSPSSAMQALALLEARGLIEARPKSGFFVRRRLLQAVRQPAPPATRPEPQPVTVCGIAAQVLRQSGDSRMLPLGAALPAPGLLPADRMSRCLASAARQQPERLASYDIAPGHPQLLRQLALHYAADGCAVPQEEILVTVGAMEAVNLALRAVTQPGDVVAVESPAFFGLLQILESLGLRALPVPGSCEHGIDLTLLAGAIERHPVKAVVLIPSFNNPNGSCLSDERRKDLLALLYEHDLPLIEDDVYGDLHFGEQRPRPVKALDDKGLVLHCSSFSKSLAPGLRVGWVAAGRYTEKVRQLKFTNTLTTPAVNQVALAIFLESAPVQRHLRQLRSSFRTQVAQTSDAILTAFPEGTALSQPQGGFFLWVQLPDSIDALALHRRALAENIAIAPGQLFSPEAKQGNHIRVSCGHPVDDRIASGISRLGHLVTALQQRRGSAKQKSSN